MPRAGTSRPHDAPAKRRREKRSGLEKGVRTALAAICVMAGYASVTHSLGYTMRAGNIDAAQSVSPGDGRLLALLSEQRSAVTANDAERRQSQWLARQALIAEPLSVAAVATLGINAALRDDQAAAKRILTHSDRLSRRDLRTRLWMIEDAAAREDTAETLRHYDIALRTSRAAPELLYPVLARAIDDAAIRRELVRTLAAKPAWRESFIGTVSAQPGDPRPAATLFAELRRAGQPVSDQASANIVGSLVNAAHISEAWNYYAGVRTGADRRRSRDPDFADAGPASLFDWNVTLGDPALAGSVQGGDRDGVFDFAAPPGVGGLVLQQAQMLPAGSYRLDGVGLNLEQPRGSRPYWTLACSDGREFGRVEMANANENGGRFAGRFTVPADCPLQYLRLILRPSNEMAGVSGQVDRVELRPAS